MSSCQRKKNLQKDRVAQSEIIPAFATLGPNRICNGSGRLIYSLTGLKISTWSNPKGQFQLNLQAGFYSVSPITVHKNRVTHALNSIMGPT